MVGRAAGNWGSESPSFAVHIVAVQVGPETGKTQILRYTALQDLGTAVYPSYVESQMQGGAVRGLEWAINEECFFDDLRPLPLHPISIGKASALSESTRRAWTHYNSRQQRCFKELADTKS